MMEIPNSPSCKHINSILLHDIYIIGITYPRQQSVDLQKSVNHFSVLVPYKIYLEEVLTTPTATKDWTK